MFPRPTRSCSIYPGDRSDLADILRGCRVSVSAPWQTVARPPADSDRVVTERRSSPTAASRGVPTDPDRHYYFDLEDAEGLTDLNPVTYSSLQNARHPRRAPVAGAGDMLTPEAILNLDLEWRTISRSGMRSVAPCREQAASNATSQPEMTQQPLPDLEPKQARYSRKDVLPVSTLGAKAATN